MFDIICSDQLKNFSALLKTQAYLDSAALQIARVEYPTLEFAPYLAQLDAMANRVHELTKGRDSVMETVEALNRHLFSELGFRGNDDAYYDPRNSFLNDVIDRHLGIPITLALTYLEVARRVGLVAHGVSFPGHFLLSVTTERGPMVLDPYSQGRRLAREDLCERLAGVHGAAAKSLIDRFLAPASRDEILVRMLRNLKAIYGQSGDRDKALVIVEHILVMVPDAATEVRDRGYLHEQLDYYRAAHADYRRYLELEPMAADAAQVSARSSEMLRKLSKLH